MVISKIMFPQDETPETSGLVPVRMERSARNILEAVGDGPRTA